MKNKAVVIYSIIALICIVLTFWIDWLFILPPIVIIFYNQKLLFGKGKKKSKK